MSAVMDMTQTLRAADLRAIKATVTRKLLDIGTDRARISTLEIAFNEYHAGYGVRSSIYRAVKRVRDQFNPQPSNVGDSDEK